MTTQALQRSAFVTVVAWLFIFMSGFACFIGLMQNIVAHFLLSAERMNAILQQRYSESIPLVAQFMTSHFKIFSGAILLLALASLASSIGLLLRRNRARLAFIGLMLVAAIWNLGSMLMQQSLLRTAPAGFDPALNQSTTGLTFISVFSILLAVVLSLLFGWIAWRLTRPTLRAEFT